MLRAARQIARDTSFSTCYICIWIHTHVHMDTYTRTYIHTSSTNTYIYSYEFNIYTYIQTSSTNTYIYSYQFNIYVHIFTPVHHDPPLKREGDSTQHKCTNQQALNSVFVFWRKKKHSYQSKKKIIQTRQPVGSAQCFLFSVRTRVRRDLI